MAVGPAASSPLLELWRRTTAAAPDEVVFTHLDDGEEPGDPLTPRALLARAAGLARALRARYPAGERILLLFPSGLDFIPAFWGCLAAGLVAVPLYPPEGRRARERFALLAQDPAPV